MKDLREAPWLLVPAAALVSLAISWLASIVLTFGTIPMGDGGIRLRLLTLLDPATATVLAGLGRSGNLGWALILLVALAIAAFGERSMSGRRALWEFLRDGTVLASAVLGGAAVIEFIIDVTYLGAHPDTAVGALLSALAVLPVCAATIWWGVALGTRDPTPYVRHLSDQVAGLGSRSRRAGSAPGGPAQPGSAPGGPAQPGSGDPQASTTHAGAEPQSPAGR